MSKKIETTYRAVFAQMVAGAYSGKEFIAAYGVSSPEVASNQPIKSWLLCRKLAFRMLGAVGFGGYVGIVEIQIQCVKRDRYARFDDPSGTWSTISRSYAKFDSRGVFEYKSNLADFDSAPVKTDDDSYIAAFGGIGYI